jgi:uncharacterized membrane protein
MAAGSTALPHSSWLRPKYLLFAAIALMMAYVLIHFEYFLVQPEAPVWQHYRPFKWLLFPHALAGACALFLGPLQFSDRLRQRFTKLHRVTGRIYVAGALIAAPLGAYIQYFEERMGTTRSLTVATAVLGALWFTTTAIAFLFILKHKVQQHRQWMTRSYAVALCFLENRVILGLTGWENSAEIGEIVVWTTLGLSVLVADMILELQSARRTKLPTQRAAPAQR